MSGNRSGPLETAFLKIRLEYIVESVHHVNLNDSPVYGEETHVSAGLFEKEVSHLVLQQEPNCREAKTRREAPVGLVGKMAAGCNLENGDNI